MGKGVIKLINVDEQVVRQVFYWSTPRRKESIREWEKLYGPPFKNMFVQIDPNANPDLIKQNGMNTRYMGLAREKIEQIQKFCENHRKTEAAVRFGLSVNIIKYHTKGVPYRNKKSMNGKETIE